MTASAGRVIVMNATAAVVALEQLDTIITFFRIIPCVAMAVFMDTAQSGL